MREVQRTTSVTCNRDEEKHFTSCTQDIFRPTNQGVQKSVFSTISVFGYLSYYKKKRKTEIQDEREA